MWTIPAERIKTRQLHIVPLSEPVLELLHKWLAQRQQQGITGNRLFGDLPLHRPIETVRKAGYDGKMTLHGCRKVFSTAAHESGLWHIDAIERQLAHSIGGVRGVYNKAQYLDERRRLFGSRHLLSQRQLPSSASQKQPLPLKPHYRTAERPDGVSERAWNRWEAGEVPIPQQVADNLKKLVAQRQALLDSLAAVGGSYTPTAEKDNIVAYKIAQSIAAQAAAMGINIGDVQDG